MAAELSCDASDDKERTESGFWLDPAACGWMIISVSLCGKAPWCL